MVVPVASAGGIPGSSQGADQQSEALGDIELDEEVERIIREEAMEKATVSTSSRRSSASKEDSEWQDKGKGKGKRRPGKKSSQAEIPKSLEGSPKKASGLPKVQIPREGAITPPLIVTSNRYGVLVGEEDAEEFLGDVEPPSSGAVSRREGAGPVPDNGKENSMEMDTSRSRKRDREGDGSALSMSRSSSREGKERKKVV